VASGPPRLEKVTSHDENRAGHVRQFGEQVDPAHDEAGATWQLEIENGAGRGVRVGAARAIQGSARLGADSERPRADA